MIYITQRKAFDLMVVAANQQYLKILLLQRSKNQILDFFQQTLTPFFITFNTINEWRK